MSNIGDLFVYLCREGGSDLHLSAGLSPRVRLHGELFDVPGWPALADATLRGMLRGLVSEAQWARFGAKHDLDTGLVTFYDDTYVADRASLDTFAKRASGPNVPVR